MLKKLTTDYIRHLTFILPLIFLVSAPAIIYFHAKAGNPNNVNSALLNDFKKLNDNDKYAWVTKISDKYTPETAWAYIRAAYTTSNGVVGNAHTLAHLVGQLLYKRYGLDGLSKCTTDFAFGCVHGMMEQAFEKDVDNQANYLKDISLAQTGCYKLGDENNPSVWSCIHGMGHGIATYRDYSINPALEDCDSLNDRMRNYCYDGVFMEFSMNAPDSFYKASDPIYPCDSVGFRYKIGCARSQVIVMRTKFSLNVRDVAKYCELSKDSTIIYHCIDSLGYFAGQTSETSVDGIITKCNEIANHKYAVQCLAAAAGELVFQNAANWKEFTSEICGTLSGTDKKTCDSRVDQVKQSYGRN